MDTKKCSSERHEDHVQIVALEDSNWSKTSGQAAFSTFCQFTVVAYEADGPAHLAEFHSIQRLGNHSPNESCFKLTKQVAQRCTSEFHMLSAGNFSPFCAMCSAFRHEYSPRYQDSEAGALHALQSATRQLRTTGGLASGSRSHG